MLLADAAQTVGGKLYLLGGGWSIMGPGPTRMAVALRFEVPWDERGQERTWLLRLVDADGGAVLCAEHGTHPIEHRGRFVAQPRPGMVAGAPVDFVVAVDGGTLTLAGGRYVWVLAVDDETQPDWQIAFTCRTAPGGP